MNEQKDATPPGGRKMPWWRAWGLLGIGLIGIWFFAAVIGPWLPNHIPAFGRIVTVIEERDIDSAAYYYTEIEGAAEGEQYLRESLRLMAPDKIGVSMPFILTIVYCLVILWLGFRYLPLK